MIVSIFFNEKDEKTGKDIALDFQCDSYSVENNWVSLKLPDRIVHIPAYRIKEVQARDKKP